MRQLDYEAQCFHSHKSWFFSSLLPQELLVSLYLLLNYNLSSFYFVLDFRLKVASLLFIIIIIVYLI